MKLQQLIEMQELDGVLDQGVALIKEQCSEYLSKPTMLLRGTSKTVAGPVRIRTDRVPLTTNVNASKMFDDAFQRQFGVGAVRTKAAFVTNDVDIAQQYGDISFVFPINGSSIAVKEGVRDSIKIVRYDYDNLMKHLVSDAASAKILQQVNTPRDKPGFYEELLSKFPENVANAIDRTMKIKYDAIVSDYQVTGPADIPRISGAEFMLYDATHYVGYSYNVIAAAMGVPGGNLSYLEQVWQSLVKRAQK